MLNKGFGVIYFHFNIFSEKKAKKQVLKFAVLGFWKCLEWSISHYFYSQTLSAYTIICRKGKIKFYSWSPDLLVKHARQKDPSLLLLDEQSCRMGWRRYYGPCYIYTWEADGHIWNIVFQQVLISKNSVHGPKHSWQSFWEEKICLKKMINITIVKQEHIWEVEKHIDANTIEIYSTLINIIARNMFTK